MIRIRMIDWIWRPPKAQHPQRQFHFEAWKPGNPWKYYRFLGRKSRKITVPRGNHPSTSTHSSGTAPFHGALCCFSRPRRPGWCAWSRSWAATSAGPNAGRCTASWMQLSTKEKWRIPNEMLLEDALGRWVMTSIRSLDLGKWFTISKGK